MDAVQARPLIDLTGQVVLVTGAGRGLGAAYARLLAEHGATLAVHDAGVEPDGSGRDPRPAQEVAQALRDRGATATVHVQDLAERAGCESLIAAVLAEHDQVDAVVHNAGIVRYHRIAETPVEEYERIMAINADAAWWLCRAVWPHMVARRYGRIVLTTSGYALRAVPGADVAAYSVSKGAQSGLVNALAGEGVEHGILVNAISPVAATRIFRASVGPGELTPEAVAPGVVALVSGACPLSGTVIAAADGKWSVLQLSPRGEVQLGQHATPEDVLAWALSLGVEG